MDGPLYLIVLVLHMIVVTGRQENTDIDTLVCAVALSEGLKAKGEDVKVVLPGELNSSVTEYIKSYQPVFLEKSTGIDMSTADFIIVDCSDPKELPDFVEESQIVAIYDHHYGFAEYWQGKLGEMAHIEPIGACATLIYEQLQKDGLLGKLSVKILELMFITIKIHTLNLSIQITNQRDEMAVDELRERVNLPEDWMAQYYEELERNVMKDPADAIHDDIKQVEINGKRINIGQLELWDSAAFVKENYDVIVKTMGGTGMDPWFFTAPCIREGKNYIIAQDEGIQQMLARSIGAVFDGDRGTTQKLWLRKEIIGRLLGKS